MSEKYYVSMTDKFLSGWGSSRGKTSKLVIVCNTRQQAEKAMDRARTREEMKYINLHFEKPYYPPSRYDVEFENIDNALFFK